MLQLAEADLHALGFGADVTSASTLSRAFSTGSMNGG
jgi:hypothetical protein